MDPIRPISQREPEVRPVQGTEHRPVKRDERDEAERRRREQRDREQREHEAATQQPPPAEEGDGDGRMVDIRA